MPIAKYKKDEKSGLYYTYEKTGLYRADGKPEYKKLRAKTIKALDEKVTAYKQGRGAVSENMTVDEWFKRWNEAFNTNLRPNTRRNYDTLYRNHVAPYIGRMRVAEVRQIHLQDLLNRMGEKYAAKTVKSTRGVISALFGKACSNNLCLKNPAEKLEICGSPQKHRRALTPAEREAYLEACKVHPFGRYAAILYFFGLRKGEALALTGADIHADYIDVTKQVTYPGTNRPVLEPPKTDAGIRQIQIPDAARPYLAGLDRSDKPLFGNPAGSYYSETQGNSRWSNFITFALGKNTEITPHYVRHNYCCLLFEQDVPLIEVQRVMGHDDLNTTMKHYAHYTETMQQNARPQLKLVGKTA